MSGEMYSIDVMTVEMTRFIIGLDIWRVKSRKSPRLLAWITERTGMPLTVRAKLGS